MQQAAKILIVDDEPKSLYAMEMLLSQEPYEICFANNGETAIAQVEREQPDIILLDVMMPGLTGYEVCRTLRADPLWQHLPIVLVTALDRKEDIVEGLDAGADEFLTKPVNGAELRARVRSMLRIKRQYDELQETIALREDLADMIVHDMRTPISSLMLYTDILEKIEYSKETCNELVDKIRHQALRLNSFLGDMLMLAKMRSGKLLLNLSSIDLVALIHDTVAHYYEIADSKNITLSVDLPDEINFFMLDDKLMARVFDNLLSNAMKYSPPGTNVRVNLKYMFHNNKESKINDNPLSVYIKVTDEGSGIPKAYRETIFNKFEVVNIEQDDVAQIGLGLALCKMVVDAHNGRIYVEDNHPTGSRFIIEL